MRAPRRRLAAAAVAVVALAALAACGGSRPDAASPAATRQQPSHTVWLCRPGLAGNPCESDLTATLVDATGRTRLERAAPERRAPVDCFYAYPTVSLQPGTNADLTIGPEQRAVAVAQASRFSRVCRVYAPAYRQLTLQAIMRPGGITAAGASLAYRSLRAAFREYLARDNHGRGIVFVGHSQGASMLTALLREEVDRSPALRRRLVSAVLLGGNVRVPVGRAVGGDFSHIPPCRSAGQTGCVVAYSSFDRPPAPDSYFGRVGRGLDPFVPARSQRLRVLCVNPAALGGGSALLDPYFPASSLALLGAGDGTAVQTPWAGYPGEYRARCVSSGGASWLQVDPARSHDPRPRVSQADGPRWGLHVDDVNLALGNLVRLVGEQATAYARGAGR